MSTSTNLKYYLPRCTGDADSSQYQEENCARDIEHLDDYFDTFMATYSEAWDSNLQWGCDCDAGFFGADCSLRECPTNYDPIDPECEGLLTDVNNLVLTDSADNTELIMSTDGEETPASYGYAYADYADQFQQGNIVQVATGGKVIIHECCCQV